MKSTFLVVFFLLLSCSETNSPLPKEDNGHDHGVVSKFVSQSQFETFSQESSFQQVGVSFDSKGSLEFEEDGVWKPAPLTFSEGEMKVAVIKLGSPTKSIRFRSSLPFTNASFQFYEELVVKEASLETPTRATLQKALAPESLVISRSEWGARDPDKRCGTDHDPKYLTVHHTALPDNDGDDPAARLRQMQAYHIDSNGWCDIGYHFIVSKSGKVYQGMASEKRSGIHVLNHNYENIGISLIGNFEEQELVEPQLGALTKILGWAANEYEIPFQRPDVRGHREWSGASTACPGTDVINKLDQIIELAEETIEEPAEPCAALGKDGGEIDNTSACFKSFGPSQYWRSEDQGFGGSLLWTNAIKAEEKGNWARWNINLEEAGTYELEYYSTPEFALFNSTQYSLAHANMEKGITIDQSAAEEGWNSLGEFEFTQGADQWLAVYDHSPFAVDDDQHIVADAIRLTRLGGGGTNNQTNQGTNQTTGGDSNNATNNNGVNNGTSQTNNAMGTSGQRTSEQDRLEVEDGCSTTSGPNHLLFFLGFVFFLRRRKK